MNHELFKNNVFFILPAAIDLIVEKRKRAKRGEKEKGEERKSAAATAAFAYTLKFIIIFNLEPKCCTFRFAKMIREHLETENASYQKLKFSPSIHHCVLLYLPKIVAISDFPTRSLSTGIIYNIDISLKISLILKIKSMGS